MIIVEGPDGSGKTTLVRKLAQELGLQIGQRATANRDELYKVTRQDTYTALASSIGGRDPVKVWDRLFFSEMVYAPRVGRETEFKPSEQRTIRAVLSGLGVPVIMCRPPLETVLKNVSASHQMSGVHESINQIYFAYATVTGTHPFTLWYDYTNSLEGLPRKAYLTYPEIVDRCQHYLTIKHERMWG